MGIKTTLVLIVVGNLFHQNFIGNCGFIKKTDRDVKIQMYMYIYAIWVIVDVNENT